MQFMLSPNKFTVHIGSQRYPDSIFFSFQLMLSAVVTDLSHPRLARLWPGLNFLGPPQYIEIPAVVTVLSF